MATDRKDGMNYAPTSRARPVVAPGEFVFAATALDHGHIYGQTNGLLEAGATLKWVYDPDPKKVEAYRAKYPQAQVARDEQEILQDPEVRLVAAAAVPCLRGPLGCRVMQHGKDYFTDKTPFTTLDQLAEARRVVAETQRKYMVYYSERLHVEASSYADELVKSGAIGRVINMVGLGPHRLNAPTRPAWFFEKAKYGGIICDIGSHQFEQFLHYVGATDATVSSARVANYHHPQYPELEDWGDVSLLANNGATFYMRVDWFSPEGLCTWGDGRTIIVGTDGTIELRKYCDVARAKTGDHLYLVDKNGERHIDCHQTVGFPFFGAFVLDCLHRTEKAMTQAHAFKAAELCLRAQAQAVRIAG
jgi:predicted dehydrogenase